eukprot:CAMPEP_0182541192 /NCGR_PEP_ID=MMETSP1323-20130603/28253_1 /TAXON_ID=236787 /ORGANISM="Florenciella parvula, Strain RCC1693" /LENGTH=80 /DNA_ID=CAMNT_0024751925 /DNA_START=101 /DNA_END=343 /DNA_ORIENTATION=+
MRAMHRSRSLNGPSTRSAQLITVKLGISVASDGSSSMAFQNRYCPALHSKPDGTIKPLASSTRGSRWRGHGTSLNSCGIE